MNDVGKRIETIEELKAAAADRRAVIHRGLYMSAVYALHMPWPRVEGMIKDGLYLYTGRERAVLEALRKLYEAASDCTCGCVGNDLLEHCLDVIETADAAI